MKALVIDEPGKARVADVPKPAPGPGEVLIRVERCGICGTDVHIFRGEYLGDYPITPGHELAGEVAAVGNGVASFAPGDRVAIEPNIACDSCPACLSNRQNFCENWKAVGVTLPGGMAEYVVAPADAVHALGEAVDLREAVCLANYQVAWALLHACGAPSKAARLSSAARTGPPSDRARSTARSGVRFHTNTAASAAESAATAARAVGPAPRTSTREPASSLRPASPSAPSAPMPSVL